MDLPWYDDSGAPAAAPDAPVLVLLHAFPLSSTMWHRLLPLLVPHVRVVRVDLPGLGRSAALRPEPPSVEAMARAVLAVLDHLDVPRAAVHGVSTGGYVALAAAGLAPGRVTHLMLSSTTPWLGEPDVPADRHAIADRLESEGSTAAVADAPAGGLGRTARREQPELEVLLRDLVASADPDGVAWAARALAAREDTSTVLAAYAGPVLLLFGEEDTEVPDGTVDAMAGLRGANPAATVVQVLHGAGHLLAIEQPGLAARALLAPLVVEPRRADD